MIPTGATLRGSRAAIPIGWRVLGLTAACWGFVFLAVQIGLALLRLVVGL